MIGIEEIKPDALSAFWNAHIRYLIDDGIISDEEDVEYFSGDEYRDIIAAHMQRECDRHHIVYFIRDGERIGAASYCTYHSEGGKCFILDFWVFPAFRRCGTGHHCFEALEQYAKEDGATFYELNSEKPDSVRFWKSLGFIENGTDEYGMPLFIRRQQEVSMIRIVEHAEEKRKIARTILEALTDWFGIPEARENYIRESEDEIMVASFDHDSPNGFLCLKETGKDTIELAVMGVLKECHRKRIGTQLFEAAKRIAFEKGYSFLQVKTVQMGKYEEYDRTNRFYLALGFKEFEVFPTLWDECNPCQIYVMSLK